MSELSNTCTGSTDLRQIQAKISTGVILANGHPTICKWVLRGCNPATLSVNFLCDEFMFWVFMAKQLLVFEHVAGSLEKAICNAA